MLVEGAPAFPSFAPGICHPTYKFLSHFFLGIVYAFDWENDGFHRYRFWIRFFFGTSVSYSHLTSSFAELGSCAASSPLGLPSLYTFPGHKRNHNRFQDTAPSR